MSKRIALSLFIVMLGVSRVARGSATSSHPLRQTELLALVGGNALPENIVNEIRARGVAFRMDDSFRAQMTTAGATPSILAALGAAKTPAKDASEEKPDQALLQHIATAAKQLKDKHYDEAADELTATLKGNFEKFEIGFVMGELLRQQENWGQAAAIYAEVLRQEPDFPEAHTKLSYVLYRTGNGVEALREAKAALLRTPQNAEAHKNAGLALHLLGKLDAALAEDQEALRIKPDYLFVRFNIALVLGDKRDFDGAIAELKKAIALAPDFADAHYRLGTAFGEKGDRDSELREYRQAKRLDPNSYPIRHDLAATFMNLHMFPEAIREFRELEAMFPDAELCRLCLGRALDSTGDVKGAEKEFRIAAKLAPSDPEPLLDLGSLLEDQKDYDAALAHYRAALELDENSFRAHSKIGSLLLTRKEVAGALRELKLAVDLNPSLPYGHDVYGQALLLSGDVDAALREFKESLALDTKQANVRLELADALEKKGDWVAALDQYRQAAVNDNVDPITLRIGTAVRVYGAAQKYKEAQERFNQHLASLRTAGKSAQAAQLEKALRDTQSTASASQKLDALMQSGSQSHAERRFDDSEREYKQALQIAETLRPLDARLATIFSHLGNLAAFRGDFPGATVFFQRQLKVAEELSGPQNPMAVTDPLRSLAMSALAQHDYTSARNYVQRALDANKAFYGENSVGFAQMLSVMAGVYLSQTDYVHAEPYLLQATDIEEKLYNYDPRYGGMEISMLMTLCIVYDKWGKPEKLEPYDRRLISLLEKQPGPDTRYLEETLAREAKTLRTLGRPDEADKVEKRLKSLKPTTAANPN
jgi:tetratricopeptide (TPR) repeat protein